MTERKRKRGKKVGGTKVIEEEEEYPFFDPAFDIDGMYRIQLSTLTQRVIGCVIGEDLTTEDPWIFISKEKIEDNLELHEESSEFLGIMQVINDYPADEMLLGFNRSVAEDKQEFLLCGTVRARNKVIAIIDQQKLDMQERLKQSVRKTPGIWVSYGSEIEVDENIVKDTRPLVEVVVESKYPLCDEKKKFRLRLAEEAVDGYIEILPGRFPLTNVIRKRVDAATQVTPFLKENEAQTNPTYPRNAWTQYKYEYDEIKLTVDEMKSLVKFMIDQADNLCETIHLNEYIDLYENDYKKISKFVHPSVALYNRDIVQFRDVLTCKDKLITDVELDPFRSGLFCVAYGRFSQNSCYTEDYTLDMVNETVFGTHLVLYWSISDNLKAKLLLISNREVTCLRFCPFRNNIVIGGCANGQIVLWDLEGKLEKVETVEILSPTEMKHRLILRPLTSWMKETEKINEIYPTAVTSLDYSHSDAVMQIAWILPNHEITRNGKIMRYKDDNGNETDNMQFTSIGLDGRILFWDLLKVPEIVPVVKQKKSQRLEKRPSALTTNISQFRHLNHILVPTFKLNVKQKGTNLPLPISQFQTRNLQYAFKAINPDPEEDCFVRTYYERAPLFPEYEYVQKLAVGDKLGSFMYCTFDGHDYDQGQKLNYEDCKYIENPMVHDGPIRCCVANRLDENVFLTVGGRVFAVWDVTKPGRPIIWRKCHCKYLGGVWSQVDSRAIVLQRDDSFIESWDFVTRTKSPGRLIRMKGNPILDLYSDQQRQHCKKRTIHVTSVVGAVRIYKIPPTKIAPPSDVQLAQARYFRDRIENRRENYKSWLAAWKRKYLGEDEEQEEIAKPAEKIEVKDDTEEKEVKEVKEGAEEEKEEKKVEVQEEEAALPKKEVIVSAAEKWLEKQEKIMYEIMLQKKKLNVVELERNKVPLQKLVHDQEQKQIKEREKLENKEEIYNAAVKTVYKTAAVTSKEKYEVKLPDDVVEAMTVSFITDYQNQEEEVLLQIRKGSFRHIFDWSEMITEGKERRNSLTPNVASYNEKERAYSRCVHRSIVDQLADDDNSDLRQSQMDQDKLDSTQSKPDEYDADASEAESNNA